MLMHINDILESEVVSLWETQENFEYSNITWRQIIVYFISLFLCILQFSINEISFWRIHLQGSLY